jgi:hypothetical protein
MKKFIRDLLVVIFGVYIGIFGYYNTHIPNIKTTTKTENVLITEIQWKDYKHLHVYTFSELKEYKLIGLEYSGKVKWFTDRKPGELSTISWKESTILPRIWDLEIHTSIQPFSWDYL